MFKRSNSGRASRPLRWHSLTQTQSVPVLIFLFLLWGCFFTPLNAANRTSVNTGPSLLNLASGQFELPVLAANTFAVRPSGAGWTFALNSGIAKNGSGFTAGNPNAPQGTQVLYLQIRGKVNRAISLAPGTYRLRFRAAQRANWQASSQTIAVRVGGKTVATIKPGSTNYGTYWTAPFKVTSSSNQVEFEGLNPNGGDNTVFVDDIRAQKLLPWSANSSWTNGKPLPGDNVTIRPNAAMVIDQNINVATLTIQGKLFAAGNLNLNLSSKRILVQGTNARLEWGKSDAPYLMRGVITLTGNNPNDSIVGMGAKFLGAMGGQVHIHGAPVVSWTRLGATANANANQITLAEAVEWKAGDKILITSTNKDRNEAEEKTILSVSGNRKVLTLTSSLSHRHLGVIENYSQGGRTWRADLRAEVGLLSHNITIQGSSPGTAGFGGHMMFMAGAKAYIDGVELYHMGQKAKLARYPMHWHMLGNVGVGQYFKNSSVHKSFNRAITIHGTESTLVEGNFFYDHIGHGVFLEDGSERFNVIRGNVTLFTRRPAKGEELTPSDNERNEVQNRTPSSYWITNPQNTFENNVAAGTEGTGFWFAFPESPMGLSATDPRFSSLQPHTLPLILFKGNSAHSCLNAFDIFDRLNPDHSLKTNKGWLHNGQHIMDSCTWYANNTALYTGIGQEGPSDNLIFRNNILLENFTSVMFASYSIVENSAIIANANAGIWSGQRAAYRVYDGAGQMRNNYYHGWNNADNNLLWWLGAGTRHVNHRFSGFTKNPGYVRCSLPNFDLPPAYADANDFEHPRLWSVVLRDLDGTLSGKANTSIIGNHPWTRVGGEVTRPNWVNVLRSDRHFVLSRLSYPGLMRTSIPNMVATREKAGTPTEHVYYIHGRKEHHQLPFIVNEGYEYTYQFEALPGNKRITMNMEDAFAQDDYIARFKDFGKLGGLIMSSSQGFFPSRTSLASLRNSTTSAYYRQPNGDLYIKAVATGRSQQFDIRWSTNFTPAKIDTDGDEMADGVEMTKNRHPFDAKDLRADFNTNGQLEGWTQFVNITGGVASGGAMKGTSTGDAQIRNHAYNFAADRVPMIQFRMKASANSLVQMFWSTNTAGGYSGTRVRSANYTGNGAWRTITLNMSSHAAWTGTITSLRFDVVAGNGKTFEVDWIRATGASKTGDNLVEAPQAGTAPDPETAVQVYPNPLQDELSIELGEPGAFETIRLVDLQGRIIREESIDPIVGKMHWSFADKPLVPGVYLVQLIGPDHRTHVKVVKLADQP